MSQAYILKIKHQIHLNWRATGPLRTNRAVQEEQEVKEKTHKLAFLNHITN